MWNTKRLYWISWDLPFYTRSLHFTVSGQYAGCSTMETLARSTFECLYDPACMDSLRYYALQIPVHIFLESTPTVLNSSLPSRFKTNTSTQTIIEELVVEELLINESYSAFYEQCSPTHCSYRVETRKTFLYALTRVLGLYGGVTISLRFIVPYIVRLVFKIRDRRFLNRVVPIT